MSAYLGIPRCDSVNIENALGPEPVAAFMPLLPRLTRTHGMKNSASDERTPEQRKRFRLVFYSIGASDILIGAAIVFLAPEYLGNDPMESQIIGGIVALLSVPMFWVGHRHSRPPKDETSSRQVFKVRD